MTTRHARLWTWSDTHAEWPENAWDPAAHAPAEGFDVVVVAGDVHTPLTRSLDWLAERLPGVATAYVPGNHDFYWNGGEDRYTIFDQLERGKDRAAALGIHLLLRATRCSVFPQWLRPMLERKLDTFGCRLIPVCSHRGWNGRRPPPSREQVRRAEQLVLTQGLPRKV